MSLADKSMTNGASAAVVMHDSAGIELALSIAAQVHQLNITKVPTMFCVSSNLLLYK